MDMSWLLNTPIAHRGLWDESNPENSLGAYQNAIDAGLNIEIDVHLLPDGDFAVFHDNNLNRVCGENIKINKITADKLKDHKLKNVKGEVTDFYIPTLKEVLDLVDGKVGLLIEMKDFDNSKGACEKLAAQLKEYKGNYAMQSFGGFAMTWWRKHTHDIPVGILTCFPLNLFSPLFQLMSKPDFLSYDIKALAKWFVNYKQKRNCPVLSWTIRTENLLQRAKDVDVNNVIFERIRINEFKK